MRSFSIRLLKDDRGTSAVEYALIVALIVLAILAGFSQVATATTMMWNDINEKVSKA